MNCSLKATTQNIRGILNMKYTSLQNESNDTFKHVTAKRTLYHHEATITRVYNKFLLCWGREN